MVPQGTHKPIIHPPTTVSFLAKKTGRFFSRQKNRPFYFGNKKALGVAAAAGDRAGQPAEVGTGGGHGPEAEGEEGGAVALVVGGGATGGGTQGWHCGGERGGFGGSARQSFGQRQMRLDFLILLAQMWIGPGISQARLAILIPNWILIPPPRGAK